RKEEEKGYHGSNRKRGLNRRNHTIRCSSYRTLSMFLLIPLPHSASFVVPKRSSCPPTIQNTNTTSTITRTRQKLSHCGSNFCDAGTVGFSSAASSPCLLLTTSDVGFGSDFCFSGCIFGGGVSDTRGDGRIGSIGSIEAGAPDTGIRTSRGLGGSGDWNGDWNSDWRRHGIMDKRWASGTGRRWVCMTSRPCRGEEFKGAHRRRCWRGDERTPLAPPRQVRKVVSSRGEEIVSSNVFLVPAFAEFPGFEFAVPFLYFFFAPGLLVPILILILVLTLL
ncbi:unnamed protein product, partial [Tuber aestivum]